MLAERVARARAQLDAGVRGQFGVPRECVDDLGAAIYGTQIDKVGSQYDLGGIAGREDHELPPLGLPPAAVGDAVPEQIAHFARSEEIADIEQAVGAGIEVGEQFGVVEGLCYRQAAD